MSFMDIAEELIASEQLNTFNVIEEYCRVCEDLTPHHRDEKITADEETSDLAEENDLIAPISVLECVRCRENEENKLDYQ